jgi:hypothetical protein
MQKSNLGYETMYHSGSLSPAFGGASGGGAYQKKNFNQITENPSQEV